MDLRRCLDCGAVLPDTSDGALCSACALKGALPPPEGAGPGPRAAAPGLSPGSTLGPYEVLGPLGAGGMGEVYRARDFRLDRVVALKVLPPGFAQDPERRARFEREARAASRLNHPHICTIHDIGEEDGRPYLVMELLQGKTLRDRMRSGRLPHPELLRVGAEVADALVAAHSEGIVHRDITPANIFVTEHGEAKVLDFGLAKMRPSERALAVAGDAPTRAGSDLTGFGTAVGTLAYMSPEQVLGRRVDASTDVFSLGVVLYEMACGKRPFEGETIGAITDGILHQDPLPPLRSSASLPAGFAALVEACLQKEPHQRVRASDVRDRLHAMLVAARGGPLDVRSAIVRWARRPVVWGTALALLAALTAGGVWLVMVQQRAQWLRAVALPEFRQLVEASGFGGKPETVRAFRLAREIEKDLAGNAAFTRAQKIVSAEASIDTVPQGATVYAKVYEEPDAPWELVGTTPVARYRAPLTLMRFKIERPGYETLMRATIPAAFDFKTKTVVPGKIVWDLDGTGTTPQGMVWIDGFGDVPRFLIDQHEVTNREFKAFVTAGGYRDRRFWKQPFVKDDAPLDWDAAVTGLVDRTGQPGPSTWEAGDFPEGQGDYPVTGVSWYEAAAYAEFAQKELPTAEHWQLAARGGGPQADLVWGMATRMLIPLSNFRGKGLAKVASAPNTTLYEVFDLPGNAREWCWNQHGAGRAIRGGAWDDPNYTFRFVTQAPPFDRSAKNGFRCVRLPDRAKVAARVFEPLPLAPSIRDYSKERPVPDAVFAAYKQQYSYDPIPLEARVEAHVPGDGWTREKVSFAAAYGSERMGVQIFLPTHARAPFQTIVYFPGAAAQSAGSSDDIVAAVDFVNNISFLLKSGRAVAYPVLKGTFERHITVPPCGETHEFAAFQRALVQDVRRTLDYLETRPDIDKARFAYTGWSWGGGRAGLVLAVEPRFKTAVIGVAGLGSRCRKLPEADEFNFVPHITLPVLMLQGKYDTNVPWETDARPFFELLGTPAADKAVKLYDTDHFIPRLDLMRESLAWFDKYLGPVSR